MRIIDHLKVHEVYCGIVRELQLEITTAPFRAALMLVMGNCGSCLNVAFALDIEVAIWYVGQD